MVIVHFDLLQDFALPFSDMVNCLWYYHHLFDHHRLRLQTSQSLPASTTSSSSPTAALISRIFANDLVS